MECRGLSARRTMNRTERRLRVLEETYSIKPRKPVRCVVVDPGKGETLEAVLAREGIGPECDLIVRTIVDPKPKVETVESPLHCNGTDVLSVCLEQFSEGKQ